MKYSRLTANAVLIGNLITFFISLFYFYHSNSAAILYSIFISFSGIICSLLTILVIVQKAKGKNSKFSYGTNRLENFNALIIALIMFICVVIASAHAIFSILYEPHLLVNFISIPVTLLASLAVQSAIYLISLKGIKSENSPLLIILSKDAKVGVFRTFISLVIVVVLWSFSIRNENYHFWLDKLLVFGFAIYGSYVYLAQILNNFKSLSDFPLDEKEQLFILKILSNHFLEYKNIRNIYTTTKGNDFIVEVEILFDSNSSLSNVIKLQEKMAADFKEKYKTGRFRIILFEEKD
ncbi:MAG: cation transporter [Bacteroidales bacterium]